MTTQEHDDAERPVRRPPRRARKSLGQLNIAGQYLGTVEAPNEKAAEAAALAEFDLSDEQRRRLVVKERN